MNRIIQHDALKTFPLKDKSIDVVITSPPYWGLRDYSVDGQIGLEKHPQEYIDHLVLVAKEIKRVLKKSGSFYLNLGDTYFANRNIKSRQWVGDQESVGTRWARNPSASRGGCKTDGTNWLQPKQLMLIPMRVAIALQGDGWVLRNDIIWHKPNPMPSSVKDRLNNTYEHVFHFVKSKKYYYNLDAIREPWSDQRLSDIKRAIEKHPGYDGKYKEGYNAEYRNILGGQGIRGQPVGNPLIGKNPGDVVKYNEKYEQLNNKAFQRKVLGIPHDLADCHPSGKNPGDFWNICTQPFTSYNPNMEHFAVFPEELIEKPIKASCPDGGIVLDPFCGRGTVGKVAKEMGLNYVLFDIKEEYCELARLYVNGQKRKLIDNQQQLTSMPFAKPMGVSK